MQYDIFISYSRKDSKEVNSLIDHLRHEIPGIKIWYDIDGIETAEDFRTKIIKAIDQSNNIIFACSDNSLESEYCEKEVKYAHRKKKTIIPYLLPGMDLDGWLLFEFGNINCIHASKPDEVSRMIKDIKKWVETHEESKDNPQAIRKDDYRFAQLGRNPYTGEVKTKGNAQPPFKIESGHGFINGHEYVDLGLPSGLLWATCNVGASKPEEYGDYFAWGEIRPKLSYNQDNCETFGHSETRKWYQRKIIKDNGWLIKKGYIEKNGNLTLSHDIAHQEWGGSWRMPTQNELEELKNNTKTEWTARNGVKGRLVNSLKNGNSIFLPAAGWRDGNLLFCDGEYGRCWSSTPCESDYNNAYILRFYSDYFFNDRYSRCYGFPVRPVSD